MTTAPVIAPAFLITHRRATQAIAAVADGTHGHTVATITTVRAHGTGTSTRIILGLTNECGAVAVATIDADHVPLIPDFLRRPGARVQLRGTVRQLPHMPTTLDVIGIAPVDA